MEKLVQQIIAYISTIPRPKNWVLKLLSLFCALFLWYFVVGEDKVDMNVSIPVEIVNLPRDLVISNQFKKQLDVTVSGQRSLIRGLVNQHITRSIDLSKAEPGNVAISNEPDSIDFPWGLSVLRVQPPSLTLLIDRLIEKELLVKPVIVGTPPNGFKLAEVILDPPTISISGPQNILADLNFLKTRPIDVSQMKESVSKQYPLDLNPDIAELIGEPVVTADINISEKTVERLIYGIPVKSDAAGTRYSFVPATVDVRVELPSSLPQEFKDINDLFLAVVRTKNLAIGQNAPKVEILINEKAASYKKYIKVLAVLPESVILEINETNKLKVNR